MLGTIHPTTQDHISDDLNSYLCVQRNKYSDVLDLKMVCMSLKHVTK